MVNIGEVLKHRREELKITVEEVSRNLKVKPRDIIAFEQNSSNIIISHIYLAGFVKSYGKILKIKDEVVEEYLKNLTNSCNTQNKKHQLVNLDDEQNKKPSREDLVNAILIFTIIYLVLISFSQFKTQNLAITDLIINQLSKTE